LLRLQQKQLKKQGTQVIIAVKMLETVFLSVLVIALLLGNSFLSLTDPKRLLLKRARKSDGLRQNAGEKQAIQLQRPAMEPLSMQQRPFQGLPEAQAPFSLTPVFGQDASPMAKPMPSFEGTAERARIDYLNRRIARLEQLLLKISGSKPIAEKIKVPELSKKLGDLDEFRQNTGLEIAALKQRLDRIQPVETRPKASVPEISDERLRDIVFRVSH
jgi:hypothetical protein